MLSWQCFPCKSLHKICEINVPAETTSPEPERFFLEKKSPVPNLPFRPSPIPNTYVAEGFPDLHSTQRRSDGLVPGIVYVRYLYLV